MVRMDQMAKYTQKQAHAPACSCRVQKHHSHRSSYISHRKAVARLGKKQRTHRSSSLHSEAATKAMPLKAFWGLELGGIRHPVGKRHPHHIGHGMHVVASVSRYIKQDGHDKFAKHAPHRMAKQTTGSPRWQELPLVGGPADGGTPLRATCASGS